MKSLVHARLKRTRAVQLAAEGHSYEEIARVVGYSHRGSAHRAVFKALEEREVEDVEALRSIEVARLDALQVALWPRAETGDTAAIGLLVRIIESRARILGLVGSRSRNDAMPDSLVIGDRHS